MKGWALNWEEEGSGEDTEKQRKAASGGGLTRPRMQALVTLSKKPEEAVGRITW